MRRILVIPVGVALTIFTACGGGSRDIRSAAEAGPNIATLDGVVSLSDLVAACTRTASATQAGAVVIRGDLRDSGRTVRIGVPCAVQLDGTAGVHLSTSTIDSETLNISDGASAAGKNQLQMTQVTMRGSANAGLILELTDPVDEINLSRTSFDFPLGIAIRATGTRTQPDSGGIVKMSYANLSSTGPLSMGVSITASTSKGLVQLVNPVIDAPGVIVVADHCTALLPGKSVDCKASTLGADLKSQAAAVDAD